MTTKKRNTIWLAVLLAVITAATGGFIGLAVNEPAEPETASTDTVLNSAAGIEATTSGAVGSASTSTAAATVVQVRELSPAWIEFHAQDSGGWTYDEAGLAKARADKSYYMNNPNNWSTPMGALCWADHELHRTEHMKTQRTDLDYRFIPTIVSEVGIGPESFEPGTSATQAFLKILTDYATTTTTTTAPTTTTTTTAPTTTTTTTAPTTTTTTTAPTTTTTTAASATATTAASATVTTVGEPYDSNEPYQRPSWAYLPEERTIEMIDIKFLRLFDEAAGEGTEWLDAIDTVAGEAWNNATKAGEGLPAEVQVYANSLAYHAREQAINFAPITTPIGRAHIAGYDAFVNAAKYDSNCKRATLAHIDPQQDLTEGLIIPTVQTTTTTTFPTGPVSVTGEELAGTLTAAKSESSIGYFAKSGIGQLTDTTFTYQDTAYRIEKIYTWPNNTLRINIHPDGLDAALADNAALMIRSATNAYTLSAADARHLPPDVDFIWDIPFNFEEGQTYEITLLKQGPLDGPQLFVPEEGPPITITPATTTTNPANTTKPTLSDDTGAFTTTSTIHTPTISVETSTTAVATNTTTTTASTTTTTANQPVTLWQIEAQPTTYTTNDIEWHLTSGNTFTYAGRTYTIDRIKTHRRSARIQATPDLEDHELPDRTQIRFWPTDTPASVQTLRLGDAIVMQASHPWDLIWGRRPYPIDINRNTTWHIDITIPPETTP